MNTTPNINLSTYTSDPNDKFNLMVTFNDNMTKIDTAVGNQNQSINLIGQTATTAVNTANTASATASEALQTAGSRASINDNVASASTTYSSNKINNLISGITPETEIDDSVTSTSKTWSSSKINTELSGKASINDTTASTTTTYSSDKIDDLVDAKASINDSTAGSSTTYSSTKINNLLSNKENVGWNHLASLTATSTSQRYSNSLLASADIILILCHSSNNLMNPPFILPSHFYTENAGRIMVSSDPAISGNNVTFGWISNSSFDYYSTTGNTDYIEIYYK